METKIENKKIFLIDDEDIILDSFSLYLKNKGYDVYSFKSAVSALKKLPQILPNIIITDIIMPEMTGIELLKKIRKYWNIPVIALSGQSSIEHVSQAVNYGVDLFLLKPINPEKLSYEINNLIVAKQNEKYYLNYNKEIKKMQRFADFSYLATGLHHNFNTPLQTISGLLYQFEKTMNSITKQENQDKSVKENINKLQKIGNSLKENFYDITKVIEDLKHLELIQKKNINPRKLFVKKMIILALKISLINEKISVESDFNDKDIVIGYEEDIVRILVNLISNAANAVKNTDLPKISIYTFKKNQKQIIRVTDNGCGIKTELIENIFKPFFSAKTSGYGAGIGLSIAKSLALNMNGDIKLVSTKAGETIFDIELPAE